MVVATLALRIVRWKAVASNSAVRSNRKARSVAKARSAVKVRNIVKVHPTAKARKTTLARIIAKVRSPITVRSAAVSTVRGQKVIASIRKPVLPVASRVREAVVRHLRQKAVAPSRAEPDQGL